MSSPSYLPQPQVQEPPQVFRLGTFGRIFSFPVMCLFLLIAVIFGFSVRSVAEPDIWWHLRNAQTLVHYHSFSPIDRYSFTAAGAGWMSDQWLSEIPFFLGFQVAGLQGLLLVYFAVLVLIFAGVYYRSCRAGADCKDAAAATFLAILLGVVSIGPRTLLFGWLCMVGLLLALDHFGETGKGLWVLPPLFALWINLHGSWVFGMVVLGLVIASGLTEGVWGSVTARRWSRTELKQLLLAFAASAAALMVNPFGYKLVVYPFDLLLRHKGVMQYLEEWRPVNFGRSGGELALVLILLFLLTVLVSRRPWRLDQVAIAAFALWAGLSHVRFLFFSGLVIIPILAPHLHLLPPYDPEIDKPWLNAIIMVGLVAGMALSFPSAEKLQKDVMEQFPEAGLKFMLEHNLNGRIFNADWWGGYIEWNAPQLKTFIDGRADIFVYNGTMDDYVDATLIKRPFDVLDKYQIDYALLEAKQPLAYLLRRSPRWRLIYSDDVADLFERTSANAETAKPSGSLSN